MDFYPFMFLFCPVICTISNISQSQVTDLGNYLDGILHNCRPTFFNPMMKHLEEMEGLDMQPDTKVLLTIAATSALRCPKTAECVADEFSQNYGNHTMPLDCRARSDQDKAENMTIKEYEEAKQQFYIILGTFIKNVKMLQNQKSSRSKVRKTQPLSSKLATNSSQIILHKINTNAMFANILVKQKAKKKYASPKESRIRRRRKKKKTSSKNPQLKPQKENMNNNTQPNISESENDAKNTTTYSNQTVSQIGKLENTTKNLNQIDKKVPEEIPMNLTEFQLNNNTQKNVSETAELHQNINNNQSVVTTAFGFVKNTTNNFSENLNQSLQLERRTKRGTIDEVRMQSFDDFVSCKIQLSPIATWLRAPLKNCMEACDEDDDCETFVHTDLGQDGDICRFYGLTKEEAGPLFKCDPGYSTTTVYAKKAQEHSYVMTNQYNGLVLTAKTQYVVDLSVFTGDNSQFWTWNKKTGTMESKKFSERFLTMDPFRVYLERKLDKWQAFWTFDSQLGLSESELLTSFKYSINVYPSSKILSMRQAWTIQDNIIPIFLTDVRNGIVLQTTGNIGAEGKPYTGEQDQEWVFDGVSVRSVEHPSRVLTLTDDRRGFNLKNFDNTGKQRFLLNEDNFLVPEECQNSIFCSSWRIGLERDYFTISSKLTAKVVDAPNANSIHLHDYHGEDHQLWFWDGESIRSKKYPNKVFDLHKADYLKNQWGKIYLNSYNAGENQKWRVDEGYLVSFYNNLRMDIYQGSRSNGAKIGVYQKTTSMNQQWSFNIGERIYFTISSHISAKVLDAPNSNSVHMWDYHGQDHQLWFWDDESIRSKKYPEEVLDLHMSDYLNDRWGKIYLGEYNGGENQKWDFENGRLVSSYKALNMDIMGGSLSNGGKVGGYQKTVGINQLWSLNFGNRLYFTISSYVNAKVLDAPDSKSVHMWSYHGEDHQLWFFDGEFIRSKKYPEKLLDLLMSDYVRTGWGKVYLAQYNGGENQKWTVDDGKLVSSYKKLNIEIYQSSKSNGVAVGGYHSTGNMNQVWSFNFGKRTFFTISSYVNAKVLDAANSNSVLLWDYHGHDNQLWFFDGELIRSKKHPEKVLDIHIRDYLNNYWGKIYLGTANGGDNQRWMINGGELVSFYRNLKMDIYGGSRSNGAKVGGYYSTKASSNQLWSFNSGSRTFFTITSKSNSKALDAPNSNSIHMWSYHGKDHQLWFWDGEFLRSKKYPETCIDLHVADYERNYWGKIYLGSCHGGPNMKWKMDDDELVSHYKDLRMDISGGSRSNGAKVGGYRRTNGNNQKWQFNAPSSGTSSCVNEVEEDIYSVVQWIPFVSTLWDLGSSIGYAAAGCTSIAEERAVSMAIGAVMDIATVATFGTGAIAFQGAKQGVKLAINIGLKEALKQGTKSLVKMGAKMISKTVVTSVTKQGIKKALKTGAKFLWKNIVVDNFNVLKNAFKLTKKFVKNPLKSTMKLGKNLKATGEKISQLKELKNFNIKSWANGDYPLQKSYPLKADDVLRCKRGVGYCDISKSNKITPNKEKVESMRAIKEKILYNDETYSKIYKENILKRTNFEFGDTPTYELALLKRRLETQGVAKQVSEEDLQKYLVYTYTVNSGDFNHMFRATNADNLFTIPKGFKNLDQIDVERNEALQDAIEKSYFIQKYLGAKPIAPLGKFENPAKVYRFLKGKDYKSLDIDYQEGKIIQLDTFTSTSKKHDMNTGSLNSGSNTDYNVDMTIHTRSGRDITELSVKSKEQQEVLLPLFSHYKVKKFEKIEVTNPQAGAPQFNYKVELEEVYQPSIGPGKIDPGELVSSSWWPSFCCVM